MYIFAKHYTCIFAADLSAAQRRSILGHKNFRDSDWSANNPQPSSEPIGKSCTLLGHMLLMNNNKKTFCEGRRGGGGGGGGVGEGNFEL